MLVTGALPVPNIFYFLVHRTPVILDKSESLFSQPHGCRTNSSTFHRSYYGLPHKPIRQFSPFIRQPCEKSLIWWIYFLGQYISKFHPLHFLWSLVSFPTTWDHYLFLLSNEKNSIMKCVLELTKMKFRLIFFYFQHKKAKIKLYYQLSNNYNN